MSGNVTRNLTCGLALTAFCMSAAVAGTGTTAPDYYRRARYAETAEKQIELLTTALSINPDHVPSLRRRAEVHLLLGDQASALADRARAAELSPRDPQLNISAGLLAQELDRHEQAVALYTRALAVEPNNYLARVNRAYARIELRRVKQAIEDADELVRLYPQRDRSYQVRVEAYDCASRFADAVDDLTTLIERSPREALYYRMRCISYRALGEGRKALADADTTLRLAGGTAGAYAARGCSYELLGELDKAFADYKRAAELNDDKRFYTIWLCLIRRKQGRRAEADKIVRNFLEDFDEEKWIAPVLRFLAGRITEQDVLSRAEHPEPERDREQHCEAYYYLGAAAMAEGKLDKAEAYFKKCVDQGVYNFYEHGFALRDLRVLAELRKKKAADKEDEAARPEPETDQPGQPGSAQPPAP
ncbi:MAG: tetratricopeptide repeat protein [Planctomycetota bacterium]